MRVPISIRVSFVKIILGEKLWVRKWVCDMTLADEKRRGSHLAQEGGTQRTTDGYGSCECLLVKIPNFPVQLCLTCQASHSTTWHSFYALWSREKTISMAEDERLVWPIIRYLFDTSCFAWDDDEDGDDEVVARSCPSKAFEWRLGSPWWMATSMIADQHLRRWISLDIRGQNCYH